MVIDAADMAQVPPAIWKLPVAGVSGLLPMVAVIVAVPPPMGRESVRLLLASIVPVTAVGANVVQVGRRRPVGFGGGSGVKIPEMEPLENCSAPTKPLTCGRTPLP
jgi:hypothetical protein